MKEIGGYFQMEQQRGREFYSDLLALNTARNALVYILKAKKIRKVYIPTYLCAVIAQVLQRENIIYEYYGVGVDFLPIFDKVLDENEAMYVVNYYGILKNSQIVHLKERFGQLILDNTHAFFQEPIPGIDTIYNCRKFFGVPDGAYLYTDVYMREQLSVDISYDRMLHLLGRYEEDATSFYQYFKEVDKSYEGLPLMYMSKLTHNLLKGIDYTYCKEKRTINYSKYHKILKNVNNLTVGMIEGAFAYPLYIKNAQEVKRKMAECKIYVPTLWPDVEKKICVGDISEEYSQLILPLPCDHRLDIDDIERVIEVLLNENAIE